MSDLSAPTRGFVIGRFQPFHLAHRHLVRTALDKCDEVTVGVGDACCARSFHNPWTPEEVIAMITAEFPGPVSTGALKFVILEDIPYDDDVWAITARLQLKANNGDFLFGFKKDDSSFYLDLFPGLKFVEVRSTLYAGMDATAIRKALFAGSLPPKTAAFDSMPLAAQGTLAEFMNTKRGLEASLLVRDEYDRIKAHDAEWLSDGARKYGVQHVAVDVLLECADEILLIRRGDNGALALPGGYVNVGERLIDAALRELQEETGIELAGAKTLRTKGGIGRLIPFDHPKRSTYGRIFTNVLYCRVGSKHEPIASDDASDAFWIKKTDLHGLRREFYHDHYHMIQTVLR